MIARLLLVCPLLFSGCGTLLRSADSVNFMSYTQIDTAIQQYEKDGTLPPDNRSDIAVLYARRSVCLAQQDLQFPRTHACINMSREGAKGIPILLIGGVLASPIGLCADTVCLPFKWWRTVMFPSDQLDEALRDLKLARHLGYVDTTWNQSSDMFSPRRKHLDHLGFTVKEEKSEQDSARYRR